MAGEDKVVAEQEQEKLRVGGNKQDAVGKAETTAEYCILQPYRPQRKSVCGDTDPESREGGESESVVFSLRSEVDHQQCQNKKEEVGIH